MKVINKLKHTDFIITASFYVCLLLIPAFVQNGGSDFSVWTAFFFSRTLNILLCITPVILAVFFRKKPIADSSTVLATADALLLFFIHSDFFVSANYNLNLLVAIFIFMFIIVNTNEAFALAGIIPFFFLNRIGVFHYVTVVAIPLIFLLITKLRTTENKTKKLIIRITLFFQCYTCAFFAFLVILKKYSLNISTTLPPAVTARFIIKAVASILLLVCVPVLFVLKNSHRIKTHRISEKFLLLAPVIYFACIGIAGFFTDILSVKNETSVAFSLLFTVIFFAQNRLSEQSEQENKPYSTNIIAISAAVLFCLSMLN